MKEVFIEENRKIAVSMRCVMTRNTTFSEMPIMNYLFNKTKLERIRVHTDQTLSIYIYTIKWPILGYWVDLLHFFSSFNRSNEIIRKKLFLDFYQDSFFVEKTCFSNLNWYFRKCLKEEIVCWNLSLRTHLFALKLWKR